MNDLLKAIHACSSIVAAFFVSTCLLVGCAASVQDRAVQGSKIAKELVDAGAVTIKEVVDYKAQMCTHLAGDRAALDSCLGPIVSKPDHVEAVFEAVRTAQLALYIALSDGSNDAEVKQALSQLWVVVKDAAVLIKAAKAERDEED